MTYKTRKKIAIGVCVVAVVIIGYMIFAPRENSSYDEDSFDYEITHWEYLNESSVTVYIDIFNNGMETVDDVWLTINFYDSARQLVGTQEDYGLAFLDIWERKTISVYFGDIGGMVDYCEIADVAVTYGDSYFGALFGFTVIVLLLLWFIAALLLNHKHYHYRIGNYHIEVSAGFQTHYIKINGETADELKQLLGVLDMKAQREGLDVEVKIRGGLLGNTVITKINGKIETGLMV